MAVWIVVMVIACSVKYDLGGKVFEIRSLEEMLIWEERRNTTFEAEVKERLDKAMEKF